MTLETYVKRIRTTLSDQSTAIWSQADIEEALRQALEIYTRNRPYHTITTLNALTAGREIDISSLSNVLNVSELWLPYTAADPEYPPNRRRFENWLNQSLLRLLDYEITAGESARIFYTTTRTINGLDSATVTTINPNDTALLVGGAAAFAATGRAIDVAERRGDVDVLVTQQIRAWGTAQYQRFMANLNRAANNTTASPSPMTPPAELDRFEGEWQ